jgi:hypothetical protein
MTLPWSINVRPSKINALSMLSLVTYPRLSQWRCPIGYGPFERSTCLTCPTTLVKVHSFGGIGLRRLLLLKRIYLGLARVTLEDCVVVENVVIECGAFPEEEASYSLGLLPLLGRKHVPGRLRSFPDVTRVSGRLGKGGIVVT